MNLTEYQKLDRHKRLALWHSLEQHPAWQTLKELLKTKKLNAVTDLNSKEEFYYQAVFNSGMERVLSFPEGKIKIIESGQSD